MTRIEEYYVDHIPTMEDIEEAFGIVKEKGNILVRIVWFVPYSGTYKRVISIEDVETKTVKEWFDEEMPKCYPV